MLLFFDTCQIQVKKNFRTLKEDPIIAPKDIRNDVTGGITFAMPSLNGITQISAMRPDHFVFQIKPLTLADLHVANLGKTMAPQFQYPLLKIPR